MVYFIDSYKIGSFFAVHSVFFPNVKIGIYNSTDFELSFISFYLANRTYLG